MRPKFDFPAIWLERGIHIPSRTILLSGSVDEGMKRQVLLAQKFIDAENVLVTAQLDTEGGDCYEGIAIYDILRSFKARVEIIGYGKIWSMGSIILQAADQGGRYLMPNSTVMLHQGYSGIDSDHPETLQRFAKEDKRIRAKLNRILYERSKLSSSAPMNQKQFIAGIQFDVYMSAVQAVGAGIADEILEP